MGCRGGTVYAVCNEFGTPPIVQRGKKGGKGELSVDEVDDAELVVDVESAAVVLQDEALLRGGKGAAYAGNQEQCRSQHECSRSA